MVNTMNISNLENIDDMLINVYGKVEGDKTEYIPNVNVAIASAISSYSRINVNQYKNIEGIKCYYSDTDSVVLDKPLPSSMTSYNELGKMKLERFISRAVYAGPKTYIEEFYTGNLSKRLNKFEIEWSITNESKIKGLSQIKPTQMMFANTNKPTFDQMLDILHENGHIELQHQHWVKNFKDSTIIVKNRSYNLRMTFTKRIPVFENGKVITTKPLRIEKLFSKKPKFHILIQK